MALIDKSALVAEIKKRKAINEKSYMQAFLNSNDNRDSFGYKVQEDIDILSLLDTLEVKEMDLEKHLKEDIEDVFFDLNGVAVKGATHYLTVEDVKDIAKHFFELGMAASNKQ